jgi:UDP-N-acetylmuramoyl-L-alanyl-D-glutamate--2,6-diaminopimelate ligase
VSLQTIQNGLRDLPGIAGRVQHIESPVGAAKKVTAVVDYAHTPDSLKQLYEAFPNKHTVCILGNTGGGRDTWKRPEMGAIAEAFCDHIILTNEDPYDEDPQKIVNEMRSGMSETASVEIIMDRRTAIKTALEKAEYGGYVLVSGKGTDPYIMGPAGSKESWSDAIVVTELLQELATK